MLKKSAALAFFIAFCLSCHSQDAENITSDFRSIAQNVPLALGNENECSNILRKNDDIKQQVEEAIKNDDLTEDDKKLLNWTKKHSDALDAFIRTVGQSGYVANYLKESELNLVKDLFDVDFVEVFKEKNFCCKLYEYRVGNYVCLLAFKPGNSEVYTIKASILIKNGSSTTTMGLETNRYRRIWSSSQNSAYKVISISCQYNGPSPF